MGEGEEEMVDTAAASSLLGVSEATVRRLVHEGSLTPRPFNPHLRRAKKWEFPRSEVERFIREGRKSRQQ